MKKTVSRSTEAGRFIVGRSSAEKFSAVEGQHRSARTGKLISDADLRGETGEARRSRIRDAFGVRSK